MLKDGFVTVYLVDKSSGNAVFSAGKALQPQTAPGTNFEKLTIDVFTGGNSTVAKWYKVRRRMSGHLTDGNAMGSYEDPGCP